MLELENSIKSIIDTKLSDGTIETIIGQEFEKCIKNALDGLFRSYGDVTKVIESKIKDVMINRLDGYNYSNYIVKLDEVLQDVLSKTTLDHKAILTNFQSLMTNDDIPKTIKMSEIFDKYAKFVENNVEVNGLSVDYDDEISYESVEITLSVEEDEKKSWSHFGRADVSLECEHDDDMNKEFQLSRWDGDRDQKWTINFTHNTTIESLRYIDDFTLFMIKLAQCGTRIELDITNDGMEVTPSKEPELSYN